jgi:hypothetical protein
MDVVLNSPEKGLKRKESKIETTNQKVTGNQIYRNVEEVRTYILVIMSPRPLGGFRRFCWVEVELSTLLSEKNADNLSKKSY